MEIGNEISQKIRSAIKAKLIEQGAYVDDELPDYIMVMVANKKTQKQMTDDLSLFLGTNTEKFTSWLHGLLKKLQSINTDEPSGTSKSKSKDKSKGEKRKHKSSDKEKRSDGDKQRKSSTGDKDKTEKKKSDDKTETADVKPVQKTDETATTDELNIIENTDEFNEENSAAEVKELSQSSSTGKPPPNKISKVDKSTDAKKSATKSSTNSSKTKSSASSSTKSREGGSSSTRKKPTSFVASVKRRYEELDEDEEEYDPNNPAVGSVASVVRGPTRKSSVPQSLQANKSLLMKAVTEAEKSVSKKKAEISPELSKSGLRSDRQPVNLKHRLKTAAGLGLISRSKRNEMSTATSRLDSGKKPRKSDEGFENMKYTIKNEATSPPKKVSPKAPASAPMRVAATALRQISGGASRVKDEVVEQDSEDEEGSEISDDDVTGSDDDDAGSGNDEDDDDDDADDDISDDVSDETEEEIEIEITDRAAQTLLNMRDENINLGEWKCTLDCRESGSQTELTESVITPSNTQSQKLSKEKLEQIDASLLDMFIENLLPFDYVENEPFKMFAKTLESKYHFPKKKKLVTEIGILYNTVRDLIKSDISENQPAAFSYCTWTSTDNQCYNTVKVHFITNNWVLRSLTLKTSPVSGSGSADDIARNLADTRAKWMITDPILVSSNTKSEQCVLESLGWQHVVCFGSCIHAVIRTCLGTRAVCSFLDQGRQLVAGLLDNTAVREVWEAKKRVLLPTELHNTQLVMDDNTTWCSTLDMLTALSQLTPALHAAVMDSELVNAGVDQLFNSNQQSSLDSLIKILSTFKTATEILTVSDQPTLQKVVPIFVKLEKVLDKNSDDCLMIQDMKTLIKEQIRTLLSTCKTTCLLACLLHPQTKQMAFVSPSEKDEIKSMMFNEVKSLYETEASEADDKNRKFKKGKRGAQRQTKAMSEVSSETDIRRVIVNTDSEDNGACLNNDARMGARIDTGARVGARVDTTGAGDSLTEDNETSVYTSKGIENLSGQTSEDETSDQGEEDGGGDRMTAEDVYDSDKGEEQSETDGDTSLDRTVSGQKLNLSITVENDWLDDVICASDDPISPDEAAKVEVNLYMAEPASNQNPLAWWKEKRQIYPHIARIAQRILSVPASSVTSEKIFNLEEKSSQCQLIQCKPEHLDTMLFLKHNKSVYESD